MSQRLLLDTNILSELINDPHGRVARKVLDAGVDNVCTSIIAAAELRYGTLKKRSTRLRRQAEELLAEIQVLPFDEPADAEYGKLRVVCDEISSPTYAPDLAQAIDALIRTEQYGIYHLTNEGACSRFEFARRILELAGKGDVPIEPITSDQWPRASTPPLHCVIRNLAAAQIGITLRHWDEALRAYFA